MLKLQIHVFFHLSAKVIKRKNTYKQISVFFMILHTIIYSHYDSLLNKDMQYLVTPYNHTILVVIPFQIKICNSLVDIILKVGVVVIPFQIKICNSRVCLKASCRLCFMICLEIKKLLKSILDFIISAVFFEFYVYIMTISIFLSLRNQNHNCFPNQDYIEFFSSQVFPLL